MAKDYPGTPWSARAELELARPFGLEFRETSNDRGMAIHVLSDVAGSEIELLAFDCFEKGPHYHYGPRNQDVRIYWDRTLVPDTLSWTLDQFKSGNLPRMIERAGYPTIASVSDLEKSDDVGELMARVWNDRAGLKTVLRDRGTGWRDLALQNVDVALKLTGRSHGCCA